MRWSKTEKKPKSLTYTKVASNQGQVRHRHKADYIGSGYHAPEIFVPLLAKFSHQAQIFVQLQQRYGNQYVRKVVSAYGNLASDIPSKKVGHIQRQKLAPFEDVEIKPLKTIYNATNRVGKNCISILNSAVRIIYNKELTKTPKLGSTIQDTMNILEKLNLVGMPTIVEFLDSMGAITKGVKEPVKLSQSVENQLISLSAPLTGWYLFGLSIMDGYHSVLIAVHITGEKKKLYWLDQTVGFKEMTGKLDSEIEKKTISWWKGVKASKTTFWTFVRVLGDFPTPSMVVRSC